MRRACGADSDLGLPRSVLESAQVGQARLAWTRATQRAARYLLSRAKARSDRDTVILKRVRVSLMPRNARVTSTTDVSIGNRSADEPPT